MYISLDDHMHLACACYAQHRERWALTSNIGVARVRMRIAVREEENGRAWSHDFPGRAHCISPWIEARTGVGIESRALVALDSIAVYAAAA